MGIESKIIVLSIIWTQKDLEDASLERRFWTESCGRNFCSDDRGQTVPLADSIEQEGRCCGLRLVTF